MAKPAWNVDVGRRSLRQADSMPGWQSRAMMPCAVAGSIDGLLSDGAVVGGARWLAVVRGAAGTASRGDVAACGELCAAAVAERCAWVEGGCLRLVANGSAGCGDGVSGGAAAGCWASRRAGRSPGVRRDGGV